MRKILATAAVLFGISSMADAQTVIMNENLTHDGSSVTVSFEVDTDVKDLPSNRKEVIMPYIYNGKDTLWMDVIEVYGKGRFKRERQINHIDGNKDWELGENQFMKGQVYSYTAQVPLKRWMKSANLGIRRQIVGCACEEDLQDENLAEGLALFEEPQMPARRIPDYVLNDAKKFWDFGQDELEIKFKVSKIEIDSSVFDNELTFGKILAAVDKIHSDPNYRIDKIEVAGYASPEGKPGFNNWLGYNRALALIDYIIKKRPEYNLTKDNFRIVNGDENWEGLKWALQDYDFEHKERVLQIINDESVPSELKKSKIKWIDHGKTWKYMLYEIFPHLRCARYLAVYYDSADDKAVETINHSNALIREGKYQEALENLSKVSDDARAFNPTGVALMMQGKFEEAMPWFEKALEYDHPEAQNNIDAINAEYRYENDQKTAIEEYLKKFE
jgi:tetratricopeptide (TPR) repeat protein